jgi:hypothetical protein
MPPSKSSSRSGAPQPNRSAAVVPCPVVSLLAAPALLVPELPLLGVPLPAEPRAEESSASMGEAPVLPESERSLPEPSALELPELPEPPERELPELELSGPEPAESEPPELESAEPELLSSGLSDPALSGPALPESELPELEPPEPELPARERDDVAERSGAGTTRTSPSR